jgi:hypothetical protein
MTRENPSRVIAVRSLAPAQPDQYEIRIVEQRIFQSAAAFAAFFV